MNRRFALCAHLGYLFAERPLEARFAAAALAGFRYVEHPAPYILPAARVAELCERHGLTMVQIALPATSHAPKGLAALPGQEEAFGEALDAGIAYALAIGCRLIHPMSGTPTLHHEPESVAETYRGNLMRACDAAAAAGLEVMVEPIGLGAVPGYYLHHCDLALATIRTINAANLRLSFDVFHAHAAGVDPIAFAGAHGASIAHVQIADSPGRHEPGSGEIDFDALFVALDRAGYAGVLGLEYHPAGGTEAGLVWTSRHPDIEPLDLISR